jgi:hypothetical protein
VVDKALYHDRADASLSTADGEMLLSQLTVT